MALTFILGAGFLSLEIHEFAGLVARGAGPTLLDHAIHGATHG